MKVYVIIVLLFCSSIFGQSAFRIQKGDKTVIPFKFISNLILIPVKINGVELTFLLDTGVAETILFSLDNKQLDLKNVEKMNFSGLGENTSIEGLVSGKNTFSVGDNFLDLDHTIYIILDEDFNFSSNVGVPVNGIIGYHFFKDFPVNIDFIHHKITVFGSEKKFEKENRKYESVPISIEMKKPYVTADVVMVKDKHPSKLLIDTGNSDSLWLFPVLIKDFVYNRPNIDDYLGRGFNGDIFGKRSRIHYLYLGDFQLEKPIAAMPDEYSIQNLKLVEGRKGSIGDETLRRFKVIFDYKNEKMYLRKNGNFKDPFLFNTSGIDVKNDGLEWDKDLVRVSSPKTFSESHDEVNAYSSTGQFQYKFILKPMYSVAGCRPGSPAYEAGIRKNDKIISINKKSTKEMTLEKITNLLKSEEGETMYIQIERNGQILNFQFVLNDPIPYQEN